MTDQKPRQKTEEEKDRRLNQDATCDKLLHCIETADAFGV